MSEENVVLHPPEIGVVTMLMQDLRSVINDPKYDRLTVSELVGALEMIKIEYLYKWQLDSN